MLSLVIDIRSDIIEGTLVHFPDKRTSHKDAVPQIIYSASTTLPHTDSGADYFTKLMIKTVGELCLHIAQEIPKYTKGTVDSIHYVFSTPWIISQSKTVKVEYDKETEITDTAIRDILHDNHEAFLRQNGPGMMSVERKIFAVEINGYVVDSFHGKRTRSLQISFAMSIAPEKLIQDIQSAVHKSFHIHNQHFHSAIILQYYSSRRRMPVSREYILMNIHGELTDVVVVKKGVSALLGSFPFGSSTLVRGVSALLSISQESAESTLSIYEESKLEESQHQKVKKVASTLLKEWQNSCTHLFEGLGESILLPRIVYLTMGTRHLSLFKNALEEFNLKVTYDDLPPSKAYMVALYHML